jgi:REP element-mobilizing transposase RayT
MALSSIGRIVDACWDGITTHYSDVRLGDYVIMPNHIHGILYLMGNDTQFKTLLGRVINAYKGAVTARIRKLEQSKQIVWQSRYYDHIIRDDIDELRIRTYIQNNVAKWVEESLYKELG